MPNGTPMIIGRNKIEPIAQHNNHWLPPLDFRGGALDGAGAYPDEKVESEDSEYDLVGGGVRVTSLEVSTKLPQFEQ